MSKEFCEYCGNKYDVDESDAVDDKLYCSAICEVDSDGDNGFI